MTIGIIMAAAILAQADPWQPAQSSEFAFNPEAGALFERDPAMNAWAMLLFDRNRDGWLSSFEAQPALTAFKSLADANRDGRVTVSEFKTAKSIVRERLNTAATAATPAATAP